MVDLNSNCKSTKSLCSLFLGKPDELPRKPLGQELVLLSPVQPSTGKPSSASVPPRAGLSLHIISHQPDSISPDQSPSKDPLDLHAGDEEEAPLPSPDPVIIHSQAPLTPDGSPLMGPPPPYQPPASPAAVQADQGRDEVQQPIADELSTDDPAVVGHVIGSTDQSSCRGPRTLSEPVAPPAPASALAPAPAQSEGPIGGERTEDTYCVQLLKQASTLSSDTNQNQNQNQDSSAASEETKTPDIS